MNESFIVSLMVQVLHLMSWPGCLLVGLGAQMEFGSLDRLSWSPAKGKNIPRWVNLRARVGGRLAFQERLLG